MHAVDVDELGILDDEFEGSDGMESDGQDGEADDSEGKHAPVWRIAGYVTWVHARHTSSQREYNQAGWGKSDRRLSYSLLSQPVWSASSAGNAKLHLSMQPAWQHGAASSGALGESAFDRQ